MALARFPDWPVIDDAGNLLADVSVEVRREDNLAALALIKSDRAGSTPLTNPFVAADGIVGFHALGGAYRIRAYKTIGGELFERVRRYVPIGTAGETDTELGLSGGMLLTFDNGTTDADPGAGLLRFNHATPASVTFLYVDLADIYASDITAWLESLDDSTSPSDKGRLRIQVAGNPAAWFTFKVTGAVVTATGYRKIPVALVASSGSTLTDGDTLAVFDVPGMAGDAASVSYDNTTTAFSGSPDTVQEAIEATKTYVDGIVAANDAMVFKGVIDCSANPNYPAADRGWTYRVSVAGKIGGASGPNVQVGDVLICLTDGTVTGNHATVGASWSIIQANIDGALLTTDLGVTVQGYDADLAAVAALASNGLIARTGAGTVAARTITGTANELTVTNGDGVSGNPTLSIPAAVTLTGKTITGGTFSGPSLSGAVALASGAVLNWNVGDITLTHSADTLTLAGGVWVVPSAGLQVGSSVPFSDAAGTLTLQNVDALDATTEATIEAAIDTLANLTSIQGHTVTLTGSLIRSGAHALTITTTGVTGVTLPTTGTLATTAYVDASFAANDAMIFKGVIDASTNPNYPAADKGHTYRISVSGKIGGASGENVQAGDLIICLTDATAAGNQATVGANWTITQTNIDGAVVGPASVTDDLPAIFDGTTGKLIKSKTYAAFKTLLALVKGDVGLGNVDNTSDATKNAATATLTNKTFDANGTGNVLSNVEVADFAASAIVTAAETIASNDNDTTIPTSAAVKALVDGAVASGVADGDKGGVVVSASGTVWEIQGNLAFPATQVPSADANTLDDYEEGTWTPAIQFGGGSTGITYGAQSGSYLKVGAGVIVNAQVILTNKGSSTGAATLVTLPFAPSIGCAANLWIQNFTGLTGAATATISATATTVQFRQTASNGSGASLTDAAVTNTAIIQINTCYSV